MKRLIFTLCIAVLFIFFAGCQKESPKIIDNSSSIIGAWELRQISGGYTTNYAPGNGAVIEFTDTTYSATGEFIIYYPQKGYYQTIADSSVNSNTGLNFPSDQFANRIILDNDTASEKIFYQISNNKLTILSGYFPTDGGVRRTYERIK